MDDEEKKEFDSGLAKEEYKKFPAETTSHCRVRTVTNNTYWLCWFLTGTCRYIFHEKFREFAIGQARVKKPVKKPRSFPSTAQPHKPNQKQSKI